MYLAQCTVPYITNRQQVLLLYFPLKDLYLLNCEIPITGNKMAEVHKTNIIQKPSAYMFAKVMGNTWTLTSKDRNKF